MGAQEDLLIRAQAIIRDLREKLATATRPAKEVAIIGMACRFPGEAVDVNAFWRMSLAGRTAATPVPPSRWSTDEASGTGLVRANFVSDLLGFDHNFFDLTPREALQMDPAQRMFLEVAWHALENAGLPQKTLAGSATGVFVGHTGVSEFLLSRIAQGDEINSYTATGMSPDVLAGRLSYLLDLHGPCAVFNSGCSSSLVALHMAHRSLLANDCKIAIVGGVNVVGPFSFDLIQDLNLFAEDGLCKTFDARANGFGRGEGCGVIVMKRLSDALDDHDQILSVLRGSAVNQDGRTNGLTAPNGLAQTAVVRQAWRDAGVTPSQVGYVETHGTGTVLGDPIEVEALGVAFDDELRTGTRCALGTAKANVGHLEGAAGIAGVIRAVCALQHRTIPPLASFQALNPHVVLEGTPFYIPIEPMPWHPSGTIRHAGVSSFGWSGTNGHVVLAEAPEADRPPERLGTQDFLIPVSSATLDGLPAMLHAMADAFEACDEQDLGAMAWSAGERRTHLAYRATVVGASGKEIAGALRQRALQKPECTSTSTRQVKFFFSESFPNAGDALAKLMDDFPALRETVQKVNQAFSELAGTNATPSERMGEFGSSGISASLNLFCLQYGLAQLLKSLGVTPSTRIGIGVGRVAAMVTRGELSVDQAARKLAEEEGYPRTRDAAQKGAPERDGGAWLYLGASPEAHRDSDRSTREVKKNDPPLRWLLGLLGTAFEAGSELDWNELPGMQRRMIALPAYRFHRDASLPGQISLAEASSPRIDHWFYQMSWREQALKAEDTPRPVRDATTKTAWLLFANDSGLAEELTRLIREDGGDATIVRHGERFERLDFSSFVADAEDHEQVAAVLDSLHPAAAESLKVLFLHALDLQARNVTAESTIDLVCQIAGISKALAARAATSARLWLVTRGAQQISAADQAGYPPQTSLWGLSAVAALEQTPQWGGIVDLGSAECKVDARFLLEECTRGDGDQRVASRGGKRHVARIMPGVAPASTPVEFSADSVYMITGAFGSIGMELAQWLVDRGARHLLLLGRSDVPELQSARSASQERAVQAIHRWREAGVRIDVAAVDVADRASMERKLSELRLEGHSLRGIFHAAAELVWMPLVEQTRVDVARSFHAKVRGAIVLDELTRDLPLEFFVFFSSAAVSMGAMGAGSYAAANAFVDALVEERRSQGRNFISVQWGYWARKDAKNRTAEEQFQRSGFVPMQPLGALDALARVMGSRTARAIVADVDLERLKAALALRGVASFLDGSQVEPKPNRMKEETALTKNLQTLEADARLREMKSWICSEIRRLCGWPSKRFIDEDRGFFDMGMTSLTSLELRRSLEVSFGSKLPGTATLLYPNVNSLAAFVHGEVFGRTINAGAMSMQPALDPDLQLNEEETRSALVAELELLRGGAYHG